VLFSSFAPYAGKKTAIAQVELSPAASWDLAPDGKQIAYAESSLEPGVVHLLAVDLHDGSGMARESKSIDVKEINQIVAVAWSADGRRLFVASHTSRGSIIWLVDETGKAKQLRSRAWAVQEMAASPDGKKLSISELTTNSNAWMIPKFPN
jgi:Tol biopolymer transport system component